MRNVERVACFVSIAVLLSSGCKSKGEPERGAPSGAAGDGVLRGVRYHLDLQGPYSMVQRTDREQVWIPSDDARPFLAVQVQPRPTHTDGALEPCPPGEDGIGKAQGAFFYVRKGDSVELTTAPPPQGVTVSVHRCLPPGRESLSCSASYTDGEMPADREAQAVAACKSLVVR